jgi:quinolinate synthase
LDSRDAALLDKIQDLKSKKHAAILAHNCQSPEIQDIADFVGDSWALPQFAATCAAMTVVICGVDFIAETAAVLCPEKTVLHPSADAACPLAEMLTAERLRQMKARNPGARVICYVKSSAAVKAESDICCTATNAAPIARLLGKDGPLIFVPDQYLGDAVCQETGLEMSLCAGYCPSHVKILPEDIRQQKALHPHARVLAHAQCTPQVKILSDAVGNTSAMLRFAAQTDAKELVVACEAGILPRLEKAFPQKRFFLATDRAICGKMKRITLETILWSLESGTPRVQLPEDVRRKARRAIDNMLKGAVQD